MVEIYKDAWGVVKKDYLAWVVLYGLFLLVATVTFGFGGVLMPNVLRESRDAIAEGRGPKAGALFDFSRIANDVFSYGVYYLAITVTSFIGMTFIAQIGLGWQMLLAAEDRYAPLDNAKLSFKHAMSHLGDHVLFMLLGSALVLPTACLCFLPLPLVMPIFGAAQVIWFNRERENFESMADASGILRQVSSS